MSYDIRLLDETTREELHAPTPHKFSGTTYAENGTDELWINYSYNYRNLFQECFGPDGIHFLQDRRSGATWERLLKALEYLTNHYDISKHSSDPWKPNPADTYDAIKNILNLGFLAPDGIWDIS